MRWMVAFIVLPVAVSWAGDLPRYPDQAFSRPAADRLSAFEAGSGLMLAPGVASRAISFEYNTLRLVPGGEDEFQTEWRFRRRATSDSGTHVAIDERIRRASAAVSVRITNESGRDVPFALHAQEMPWEPVPENRSQAWILGETQTVPAGETCTLRFDTSHPIPTDPKSPRARVLYPLSALYLLPTVLEDEVDYHFLISHLTIHYPLSPALDTSTLRTNTRRVTAGTPIEIDLTAASGADLEKLTLELRRGDRVLWRIMPTPAERARLAEQGHGTLTREVPWYLPKGDYALGAVHDGYRTSVPDVALTVHNDRNPELPKVTRASHLGRTAVLIDGKPFPWVGYSSYDYQPGNVAQFADGHLTVACVPVAAGRHVHHHAAATTTPAPGEYDFSELDERVAFSLQSQPEARIMLRASLAPPHYWMQDHERELARIRTDQGDLIHEETGARQVAMTSRTWREYQADLLRALVEHCKAQPWADRFIGLWVTGGVTEEWFAWGCNEGLFADYAAPNEAAFAAWCEARGLPWRSIPGPDERAQPGHDLYPPTASGEAAAAYARFASESTAETIAYFARVVKDASQGRLLAGTFYGYVIQLVGEPRQHLSGHFALRQLLDCPDIDFFGGIPLHDYRTVTNGYAGFVTAHESIAAAGKLFCNENDLFSWLHPILWNQPYDPEDPRGAAITMHRRVAAHDLVHGAQRQWFSLMASWHDDDALQQEFARQADHAALALTLDRTPREEVAFLVDDTSIAWAPPETDWLRHTNRALQRAAGTLGTPMRVWLLSDVDKLPSRVRFIIVADARAAAPKDIEKLRAIIEAGGRTILLVGPVGLVDPTTQTWDLDAPARLTGLPIVVEPWDAPVPETAESTIKPRAHALSSEDDLFVERDLPNGGRLLWSALPAPAHDRLRDWMEQAGVFFYAPAGCQVGVSKELVAVTASEPGEVPLRWRGDVAVTDLYDGWTGTGTTMVCPFTKGQTRLFRVSK